MRLFGLIGFPLGHSFSGKYFSGKFQREGITDARYELFPISDINAFPRLWQQHPELQGLNVTIPYKEAVIPFLDHATQVVRSTGACNCVHLENGSLVGYNTDVVGFEQTLAPLLKPVHHKALILGTGGASKAVAYVLDNMGIGWQFVSRAGGEGCLRYDQLLPATMKEYPLIINTTPLGMYPNVRDAPSLPYEAMSERNLLYDLVYNPPQTEFLKRGKERGAMTCNGAEMLMIQAEESWRIWNAPVSDSPLP
jgi:shikimate dehydrogenase